MALNICVDTIRRRRQKASFEARKIVEGIYLEIKEAKDFWRNHLIHHIDKDHFNNDPNNLAIILKFDHWIYHRDHYKWGRNLCSFCGRITIHLNNRCTVCKADLGKISPRH